jgi:deazaflavin-dependent oxidoreductase (nitroreductase family)
VANPFAKSRWFHRIANYSGPPAFFRVLPVPRGFALLTVTGRRTGKRRRRPIRAIRDGSTLYAVAILGERSDWLRNLRANPRAEARLGIRTREMTLRGITDPVEHERAEQLYVETVVPYDYFDVPIVDWTFPLPARIRKSHRDWLRVGTLVALELESPDKQ